MVPQKLANAIALVKSILGLEPTRIVAEANYGQQTYYAKYGGLCHLLWMEGYSAIEEPILALPGIVKPGLRISQDVSPENLGRIALLLQGIATLPPERPNEFSYNDLADAVMLTLFRRWSEAKQKLASWIADVGDKPAMVALHNAYMAFVLQHELICRDRGLVDPLTSYLTWRDIDGIYQWAIALDIDPSGGGILKLDLYDGIDNCPDELNGLETKDGFLKHLDRKISELCHDLITAQYIRDRAIKDDIIYCPGDIRRGDIRRGDIRCGDIRCGDISDSISISDTELCVDVYDDDDDDDDEWDDGYGPSVPPLDAGLP